MTRRLRAVDAAAIGTLVRGIVALLSALVLVGCGPSTEPAPPAKPAAEVSVPDLFMTEVNVSGQEMTAAGLRVEVVRPAFTVEPGPETSKPGQSFEVEEYRALFKPDAWDHWVTGQEPAAGTVLKAGETLVLIAGEHQGGAPGERWLATHGKAIKKAGTDEDCMESCHKKDHCTECHDRAGVKDEAAPKK